MNEHSPSEPARAHTPPSPPRSFVERRPSALELLREDDDRIATELPQILPPAHYDDLRQRELSVDDGWTLRPQVQRAQTQEEIDEEEAHRRLGLRYHHYKLVRKQKKWYHFFTTWWSRHVNIKVDVATRRDHLALERTFLSYLRTSLALSMIGVTIAQLFRLQHSPAPSAIFGYFVAGEPLAGCFIAAAVVVVLVGAVRFWRQQTAMVRGKVWAGGWEVYLTMGLSIAVSDGAPS
jgi:uncharacterized membrane protein YidH (DUF202 family)